MFAESATRLSSQLSLLSSTLRISMRTDSCARTIASSRKKLVKTSLSSSRRLQSFSNNQLREDEIQALSAGKVATVVVTEVIGVVIASRREAIVVDVEEAIKISWVLVIGLLTIVTEALDQVLHLWATSSLKLLWKTAR